VPSQVERVRQGGELPPWYDLSEWDDSGDTPAADTQSVSLQVRHRLQTLRTKLQILSGNSDPASTLGLQAQTVNLATANTHACLCLVCWLHANIRGCAATS